MRCLQLRRALNHPSHTHFSSHRLIQHSAFGFHYCEPVAGAGDAGEDQFAGEDD